MVRTLADCVRLVLRRAAQRLSTKMPQHSRGLLLSMLPTNAVGAEIRVHEGDFSRRILDVLRLRKMHLIDPWQYQTGKEFAEAYYADSLCEARIGLLALGETASRIRPGDTNQHRPLGIRELRTRPRNRTERISERERQNFNHALFALAFFSQRQDRELLGAISRGLLDCPRRV